MNKNLKILLIGMTLFVITLSAIPVSAQVETVFPVLSNPLRANSVQEIIFLIVDLAMNVGIILAVVMIIYSGFRFVLARGNPSELESAKKLFFSVIIGTAILIGAKGIVLVLQQTFINAGLVKESTFKKNF